MTTIITFFIIFTFIGEDINLYSSDAILIFFGLFMLSLANELKK